MITDDVRFITIGVKPDSGLSKMKYIIIAIAVAMIIISFIVLIK